MVKLILKSPYIKNTGNAGGYLKYIGTRENVELVPDARPPTKRQTQLINKLLQDFPNCKNSYEYSDYHATPTKVNASALITMALESNWDAIQSSEVYMKYIATRPRAERFGSHGLFGDEDTVDMVKAMSELENYRGNVWTHIISLRREDAERLGYNNAAVWKNLIRTHRNEIAAAMKIPVNDFRWYAAFHDEGHHPHIHMMAWSAKAGQAYLSRDGIEMIKSKLTNDIFCEEMMHLYEQKTVARDELVQEARQAMLELVQKMREGLCSQPKAEQLIWKLSMKLETVQGKKSYGYLPKSVKKLVDNVVDEMERLPVVRGCYEWWLELQGKVQSYYTEEEIKRFRLSQQKEFRQIKNAVINEALKLGALTFEDGDLHRHDEPDPEENVTLAYWDFREIIHDRYADLSEKDAAITEMQKLAESGDVHAQYLMGKLYRDGDPVLPDSRVAEYWFKVAAEQGLDIAQYAQGKLYLSEDIEMRNMEQGIRWLIKAADNGNGYAAYRLGKECLKGTIVKENLPLALDYLMKTAEANVSHAQYLLGKLCLEGKGIEHSREKAAYWFAQAAEQGHDYAQALLDRMEEMKPPSVLLSSTRLFHHMSRIFQGNSLPKSAPGGIQIDRKRMEQLREKRIAMGHKPDDHEEQTYTGPTMSLGW